MKLKLKDGEILVLRTCSEDGVSRDGFKWPLKGKVSAPDWEDTDSCGHGLHGLPWGAGKAGYLSWNDKCSNGWVIKVDTSNGGYRHGTGDMVDKCKFKEGTVILGNASREDCIKLIKEHCPKDIVINWDVQTAGDLANQTAGYAANQTAGYAAKQTAGDEAKQTAGNLANQTAGYAANQTAGYAANQTAGDAAKQTAGDAANQTAGDAANQTAGDEANQTAGDEAKQTAGDEANQTAGYAANQTAGDEAKQTAGYAAKQTAGDAANQTAGYAANQKAGIDSLQIIRYYSGKWNIKTRVITAEEADKWYKFENGDWRLCTAEEVAELDKKG